MSLTLTPTPIPTPTPNPTYPLATKELTSFALELPVFRELGDEIIPLPTKHMNRRGSSYLQVRVPP